MTTPPLPGAHPARLSPHCPARRRPALARRTRAAAGPRHPALPTRDRPHAGLWALLPRRYAQRALGQLTGRQRDVLALMAEGYSNHAIAGRLYLTEHTVEKHIKNIFATLRLTPSPQDHRRVLAVLAYLQACYPPTGS